MIERLSREIQKSYGIAVRNIIEAPRQFVAETYVIQANDGQEYFCKVITKPLFIPHVIESLPVLKDIHDKGFERLNYPIPTLSDDLFVNEDGVLKVLFNYIDAPQSYEYSNYEFGRLLGQVHQTTGRLTNLPQTEQFTFKYEESFLNKLRQLTNPTDSDNILTQLKVLLSKYLVEIQHDYQNFQELSGRLRNQPFDMVVTHGDPGGNVLAKSSTDLYLIDWDDILLSPPERDTWFLQHNKDFLDGYRTIFQNYEINPDLCRYFTYKRYFEDLMEYFAEITDYGSEEHRLKNLKALQEDCFEGWLRPSIRKFDPFNASTLSSNY